MCLQLVDIYRLIAEGTLGDVLDAEVIVQLKLRFLYRFTTKKAELFSLLADDLNFLPIIAELVGIFSTHGHEGGLGLRFFTEAVLCGAEIRHGRPHLLILLHVHLQFFILLPKHRNLSLRRF